jgi:methylmalonyl-CoA/ethylmalonyl-CoA epimerase
MTMSPLADLPVAQVALVVRDIKEASRRWAEVLGAEVPPVRLTGPRAEAHTVYRGSPTEARAKLAFFKLGPVSLELIEPDGRPSTWQEFLDAHGEGVHHIAFGVKGLPGVQEFLSKRGMETVQTGDYPGGRYAYVDTAGPLKVILEFLESRPTPSAEEKA